MTDSGVHEAGPHPPLESKREAAARSSGLAFARTLQEIICGVFDNVVGRLQSPQEGGEGRALVVSLLLDGVRARDPSVELEWILFAAVNFVTVCERVDGGPWVYRSCHDSCWRQDGVDKMTQELLYGRPWRSSPFCNDEFTVLQSLGGGLFVVELTEEQRRDLKKVVNTRLRG